MLLRTGLLEPPPSGLPGKARTGNMCTMVVAPLRLTVKFYTHKIIAQGCIVMVVKG